MYARQVTMNLRPGKGAELASKIESEVLPLLRRHQGFRDEITFIAPTGKEAFAVSFWDSKESAEAYSRIAYGDVNDMLSGLIDGKARVRGYDVVNSTCHKIAATLKAA